MFFCFFVSSFGWGTSEQLRGREGGERRGGGGKELHTFIRVPLAASTPSNESNYIAITVRHRIGLGAWLHLCNTQLFKITSLHLLLLEVGKSGPAVVTVHLFVSPQEVSTISPQSLPEQYFNEVPPPPEKVPFQTTPECSARHAQLFPNPTQITFRRLVTEYMSLRCHHHSFIFIRLQFPPPPSYWLHLFSLRTSYCSPPP